MLQPYLQTQNIFADRWFPDSISIIGSEQIKLQGLKGISDVLDFSPGVTNSQGEVTEMHQLFMEFARLKICTEMGS